MRNKNISSSNSTFPFDCISIKSIPSRENFSLTKSNNFNQNANDSDENLKTNRKYLRRLIQSSTDISIDNIYSFRNHSDLFKNNRASRIESALLTSDYSHLLNHSWRNSSRHIIDINTNQTIDRTKRNGAGDENPSLNMTNKSSESSILTDQNPYLILEQIPIENRQKIHLTIKQLLLLSMSVFVFVILLCLITIVFIF